jgi:chromosome condensin MukBEF MukE localization factor
MSKGLGLLILGGLAVIGGAIFAAMVIKNKLAAERAIEFDEFDDYEYLIDEDEEFEGFINEKKAADSNEEA